MNGDGLLDLVVHFKTQDLNADGLLQDGVELVISGETLEEGTFEGSDLRVFLGPGPDKCSQKTGEPCILPQGPENSLGDLFRALIRLQNHQNGVGPIFERRYPLWFLRQDSLTVISRIHTPWVGGSGTLLQLGHVC